MWAILRQASTPHGQCAWTTAQVEHLRAQLARTEEKARQDAERAARDLSKANAVRTLAEAQLAELLAVRSKV